MIQSVLELGAVADITIEDPPLEDVIAHIYGLKIDRSQQTARQRHQGGSGSYRGFYRQR